MSDAVSPVLPVGPAPLRVLSGEEVAQRRKRALEMAMMMRGPSSHPSNTSMYVSAEDRAWWNQKLDPADISDLIYKENITNNTVVTSVPLGASVKVITTNTITLIHDDGITQTSLATFALAQTEVLNPLNVKPDGSTVSLLVSSTLVEAREPVNVKPDGTTTRLAVTDSTSTVSNILDVRPDNVSTSLLVNSTLVEAREPVNVKPDGTTTRLAVVDATTTVSNTLDVRADGSATALNVSPTLVEARVPLTARPNGTDARLQVTNASTTVSNDLLVKADGSTDALTVTPTAATALVPFSVKATGGPSDDFTVTGTTTTVLNNLNVRPDGSTDVLTATPSALTSTVKHTFTGGLEVSANQRADLLGVLVTAPTAGGLSVTGNVLSSNVSPAVNVFSVIPITPPYKLTIDSLNLGTAPINGQRISLLVIPPSAAAYLVGYSLDVAMGFSLVTGLPSYDNTDPNTRGFLTATGSIVTVLSFGSLNFVYSSAAMGTGAWIQE